MTPSVELYEVSKWFGQKVAVSEVTLSFGPGVTGLLGPNGAGKTTLMRLVTGLQVPSQGSVNVLGVNPRKDPGVYAKISMVPEDEAVYTNLTALEFVELNASLAGVPNAQATAGALLEQVGLAGDRDRRLGEYSGDALQALESVTPSVTDGVLKMSATILVGLAVFTWALRTRDAL